MPPSPKAFFGSIAALCIAVITFLCWKNGIGHNELAALLATIMRVRGFTTLTIGIALVSIVLAVEWNAILNYWRIQRISLREVEWLHPRLPSGFEILSTNLLSLAFILLSVQFIATVYAMTFTLLSSTTEANATVAVVMADFDNDGDLDYVAGNTGASLHDPYRNSGTGAFAHLTTFADSASFLTFKGGDLNGDGIVDLLEAFNGASVYGLQASFNNGAMSFTNRGISSLTSNTDIAVGDVNNDGKLDAIAVASAARSANAVYLGSGTGGFTTVAATLPAADRTALADFNSDGFLDLALSYNTGNSVKTYLGSGTGSFVPGGSITVTSVTSLATGDLDNNGTVDIMACDYSAGACHVLKNSGTGGLTELGGFSVGFSVLNVTLGDVDNDGDLDALACVLNPPLNASGYGCSLFLNNGAGTFTTGSQILGQQFDRTNSVGIGDIDNDGDLDVVLGNATVGNTGKPNRYYVSDQAATLPNTAPSAPNGLTVVRVTGGNGSGSVRLSWGSGSDTQ
ncbi:MAG: VCBS repeat-containing protein, partial [Candidatus Peribacteraceae bacterium]